MQREHWKKARNHAYQHHQRARLAKNRKIKRQKYRSPKYFLYNFQSWCADLVYIKKLLEWDLLWICNIQANFFTFGLLFFCTNGSLFSFQNAIWNTPSLCQILQLEVDIDFFSVQSPFSGTLAKMLFACTCQFFSQVPWVFTGRTDAEAETPILWPPDTKNWLTGKDPDAGKDWRQEEKGMTEDEMVGWHHWLNGHEFG